MLEGARTAIGPNGFSSNAQRFECLLLADFVAKVGNGKSEAVASMSLSGLLHPLHLAAGPLRQRH